MDLHLGAGVRARRRERGLTQKAMADLLGLSHQQVQKYENGSNRMTALVLYEIATLLDAEVGDFYAGLRTLAAPRGPARAAGAPEARRLAELRDAYLHLPPDLHQPLIAFIRSLAASPPSHQSGFISATDVDRTAG